VDVSGDFPVVGMREPCPCGSGRRYKACHGRDASRPEPRVTRPFEGLASECDWVALREIVPAATAPLALRDHDREVILTTVLPMAWPALVRDTGEIYLALQVTTGSGDPSRDAAVALLEALDAQPGTPIPPSGLPGDGPRLQDLLADAPLKVTVHDSFDYWMSEDTEATGQVRESLDRANARVMPTQRLTTVEAAYWIDMGDKRFLRWVLPQEEESLLNALARLKSRGDANLSGLDSRFVGSFRADGLLVPVWELPPETSAEACEEPAAAYADVLAEALADTTPLTAAERGARAGLQTRQITLR
jgi:hypothetical protein